MPASNSEARKRRDEALAASKARHPSSLFANREREKEAHFAMNYGTKIDDIDR